MAQWGWHCHSGAEGAAGQVGATAARRDPSWPFRLWHKHRPFLSLGGSYLDSKGSKVFLFLIFFQLHFFSIFFNQTYWFYINSHQDQFYLFVLHQFPYLMIFLCLFFFFWFDDHFPSFLFFPRPWKNKNSGGRWAPQSLPRPGSGAHHWTAAWGPKIFGSNVWGPKTVHFYSKFGVALLISGEHLEKHIWFGGLVHIFSFNWDDLPLHGFYTREKG